MLGEHAEAPDEVDGGDQPGLDAVAVAERRQLRLRALAPQPDLVGGEAEARPTHVAGRVHERLQLRRPPGRWARRPACR